MISSTLTTKAQTTVPRAVRDTLKLKPGDRMSYELREDHVVLKRIVVADDDDDGWDPFATFWEWDSEADRAAYGD